MAARLLVGFGNILQSAHQPISSIPRLAIISFLVNCTFFVNWLYACFDYVAKHLCAKNFHSSSGQTLHTFEITRLTKTSGVPMGNCMPAVRGATLVLIALAHSAPQHTAGSYHAYCDLCPLYIARRVKLVMIAGS